MERIAYYIANKKLKVKS